MQTTKLDEEKPQKPEDVKHVAFTADKLKEATTSSNYSKLKPLALGSESEPAKPSSSL